MLTSLALCLLASPAARGQAAESPLLRDALPADAVFAAVVEDFAALWERARAPEWAAIAGHPVLRSARERADAFLQGKLDDEEVTLARLLDALAGAAFFAGSLERDDLAARGFVLRLRPGFPQVAAALRRSLRVQGEVVDVDGAELVVARGGAGAEVSFAWSGGVGVVEARTRATALELAASLAGTPQSEHVPRVGAQRLPQPVDASAAALEVYWDIGSWFAAVTSPRSEDDERVYCALQIDEFGWAALHLSLDRDAAPAFDLSLELPAGGPWPLLAAGARPVPASLARLAPATAFEVSALGYDVRGTWSALRRWLEEALPDAAEELERDLDSIASSGIDLERDVFAQLTGEFANVLLPLTEERTSLNGVGVGLVLGFGLGILGTPASGAGRVYLIGIEEVPAIEALIVELLELADAADAVERLSVAGHAMGSLQVPGFDARPSWGLLDGVLVLSPYASGVRAILEQAAADPAPSWLDARRREALLASGSTFRSSAGDWKQLVQVELLAPLERVAEILGILATESLPTSFAAAGNARSSLSVEGRVVRYRFWVE